MATAKNLHFAEGVRHEPFGARWAVGVVMGWQNEGIRPPLSPEEDQRVANYLTGTMDTGISHVNVVGNRQRAFVGARALLFTTAVDKGKRSLEGCDEQEAMLLRREIPLEKGLAGMVGALAHIGASRTGLTVASAQVVELARNSQVRPHTAFADPRGVVDLEDANKILSGIVATEQDLLKQIALAH